jgi:hypothetical protein
MQNLCFKCYEEINHFLPAGRELDLLLEIKRWLASNLNETVANDLIDEAVAQISERKQLLGEAQRQASVVCRYCLAELIFEALTDRSPAVAFMFRREFLKNYALDDISREGTAGTAP